MFPGRPFAQARGRVVSISAATLAQPLTAGALEMAPPGLVPDKFVAVAVFDNPDGLLVPGMAGRAKIYAERSSPIGIVVRLLRRWIQTIVW